MIFVFCTAILVSGTQPTSADQKEALNTTVIVSFCSHSSILPLPPKQSHHHLSTGAFPTSAMLHMHPLRVPTRHSSNLYFFSRLSLLPLFFLSCLSSSSCLSAFLKSPLLKGLSLSLSPNNSCTNSVACGMFA